MITKPPPLNFGMPIILPMKGKAFVNQGPGLVVTTRYIRDHLRIITQM